jgi:hypothetical protein
MTNMQIFSVLAKLDLLWIVDSSWPLFFLPTPALEGTQNNRFLFKKISCFVRYQFVYFVKHLNARVTNQMYLAKLIKILPRFPSNKKKYMKLKRYKNLSESKIFGIVRRIFFCFGIFRLEKQRFDSLAFHLNRPIKRRSTNTLKYFCTFTELKLTNQKAIAVISS